MQRIIWVSSLCLFIGFAALIVMGCQPVHPISIEPSPTRSLSTLTTPAETPITETAMSSTTVGITRTAIFTSVATAPSVTNNPLQSRGDEATPVAQLGPPGTQVLDVQTGYTLSQSSQSLEETETYFLTLLQGQGNQLLERLWTDENKYGGQSFFLLFWRQEQANAELPSAVCVHGFAEGSEPPLVYIMYGECSAVRSVAESLRRAMWLQPEQVQWAPWQEGDVAFVYPAHWQLDAAFLKGPICQTQATDCVVALQDGSEASLAMFRIVKQPRMAGMEPLDYGQALYQQLQQDPHDYALITSFPLVLESGQAAVQDIYLYRTEAGTPAIEFSTHAVTPTDYYLIAGSAIVGSGELSDLYAVVSAMARSVQIEE